MWYLSQFFKGYKPVLSCGKNRYSSEYLVRLARFPHIETNPSSYLFFQNEKLKDKFLRESSGITPHSIQYHKLIGLTLGYPPRAVDFYIQIRHLHPNESLEILSKKIFIHYCGMSCVANLDYLVDDVSWFWNRYQYPKTTLISTVYRDHSISPYIDEFPVPYGDYSILKQLHQKLKRDRELYLLKEITYT